MYELIRNAFIYKNRYDMCHNAVFGYNKNIWMAKKRYFHETVLLIVVSSQFMVTAFAIGHLADYGVLRMNESIRYFL